MLFIDILVLGSAVLVQINPTDFETSKLEHVLSRLHFFMPGFAPLTARGSQQYR